MTAGDKIRKRPYEGFLTHHLIHSILHEHQCLLDRLGMTHLSGTEQQAIGAFSDRTADLCEQHLGAMQAIVDSAIDLKTDRAALLLDKIFLPRTIR